MTTNQTKAEAIAQLKAEGYARDPEHRSSSAVVMFVRDTPAGRDYATVKRDGAVRRRTVVR